jgi:hypothetical protein
MYLLLSVIIPVFLHPAQPNSRAQSAPSHQPTALHVHPPTPSYYNHWITNTHPDCTVALAGLEKCEQSRDLVRAGREKLAEMKRKIEEAERQLAKESEKTEKIRREVIEGIRLVEGYMKEMGELEKVESAGRNAR